MSWEFLKTLVLPQPRATPDIDGQKLIWNDAAKIEAKVKELVADQLDVDIRRVTPDADWYKDFDCSLDVVEVFMRAEEEFGIEIPDEDAEQCETVGKLTAYIQRRFGLNFRQDIETIIEQFSAAHPAVRVEQLQVKFPGADDDGLWFFTHPDCAFEVQLESSSGRYPFLVETGETDERTYVHDLGEALTVLAQKLHLRPPER